MQAIGHRAAVDRVQRLEGQIGLRRHLLQHLARMQLVLRGQDGFRRCAGQAQFFGHKRSGQGTELLVMRDDSAPAQPPATPGQASGKAMQVEVDQVCVAGKGEQVETRMIEACPVAQGFEGPGVPVEGEEQPDAGSCTWIESAGATHRHVRPTARAAQGKIARTSSTATRPGESRSLQSRTCASVVPA